MIKLVHPHLETQILLTDEYVNLLIIENPQEFYSDITELLEEFNGEEGNFVFSKNDKEVTFSSVGEMVINIFELDINGKKPLNLLYKFVEKQVYERENFVLYNKANIAVTELLNEVFSELPFQLSYNEIQPSDILKGAGVKFEKVYENLIEKIICYINAMVVLRKPEFFVFVNLKSVLGDDDLKILYNHCRKEKVCLLLIENAKCRNILSEERAVIITDDLCEIVENYS